MREEFKLAMTLLFEGVLVVPALFFLHALCAGWDLFSDSYVLVTKVIYADEPCKSKIAHLVIPWLTVRASLPISYVCARS